MKQIRKIRKIIHKGEEKGEKMMMTVLTKCAEISTDIEENTDTQVSTNTRKTLNDIRRGVLKRRKQFESYEAVTPVIYDATIENDFFKHMKKEIYKNILEAEGDEN